MGNNDNSIISKHKFFAISQSLMMNKDLSSDAKLMYIYILDKLNYTKYRQEEQPYWYLTSKNRKQLLEQFGLSESKFHRIITELKKMDLIRTKQFGSGVRFFYGCNDSYMNSVCQKRKTRFVKNEEPGLSNLTNPLNKINKTNINKINSYSYSISKPILNLLIKAKNEIPTNDDVRMFFKEQGFTDTADAFFEYYSGKNWTIRGKPVSNWKKLAYAWNQNQWVFLPDVFYNPSTAINVMEQLPEYVQNQIINDQAQSPQGMVKVQTLELLNSIL